MNNTETLIKKSSEMQRELKNRYSLATTEFYELYSKYISSASSESMPDAIFYLINDTYNLGFIRGTRAVKNGRI